MTTVGVPRSVYSSQYVLNCWTSMQSLTLKNATTSIAENESLHLFFDGLTTPNRHCCYCCWNDLWGIVRNCEEFVPGFDLLEIGSSRKSIEMHRIFHVLSLQSMSVLLKKEKQTTNVLLLHFFYYCFLYNGITTIAKNDFNNVNPVTIMVTYKKKITNMIQYQVNSYWANESDDFNESKTVETSYDVRPVPANFRNDNQSDNEAMHCNKGNWCDWIGINRAAYDISKRRKQVKKKEEKQNSCKIYIHTFIHIYIYIYVYKRQRNRK